ncbi:cache domain-containing protein, partial [Plasticicumulans acidivorans]
MKSLTRLGLSAQFSILLCMVIAGLAISAGVLLHNIHSQLDSERQARVEELVEMASNLVDHYVDEERKGQLSHEEAQQRAIRAISALRYQDTYYWVHTRNGTYVAHAAKPELVGKSINISDKNGKNLFEAFDAVIRKDGHGFVDYVWPRAGGDVAEPKLSYVKLSPAWGWIIGLGLYVSDVEQVYAEQRTQVLTAFGLVTLLLGAALWWQARRIVGQVRAVLAFARRLAANDLS